MSKVDFCGLFAAEAEFFEQSLYVHEDVCVVTS